MICTQPPRGWPMPEIQGWLNTMSCVRFGRVSAAWEEWVSVNLMSFVRKKEESRGEVVTTCQKGNSLPAGCMSFSWITQVWTQRCQAAVKHLSKTFFFLALWYTMVNNGEQWWTSRTGHDNSLLLLTHNSLLLLTHNSLLLLTHNSLLLLTHKP